MQKKCLLPVLLALLMLAQRLPVSGTAGTNCRYDPARV